MAHEGAVEQRQPAEQSPMPPAAGRVAVRGYRYVRSHPVLRTAAAAGLATGLAFGVAAVEGPPQMNVCAADMAGANRAFEGLFGLKNNTIVVKDCSTTDFGVNSASDEVSTSLKVTFPFGNPGVLGTLTISRGDFSDFSGESDSSEPDASFDAGIYDVPGTGGALVSKNGESRSETGDLEFPQEDGEIVDMQYTMAPNELDKSLTTKRVIGALEQVAASLITENVLAYSPTS